jgi:hypothetical protein
MCKLTIEFTIATRENHVPSPTESLKKLGLNSQL